MGDTRRRATFITATMLLIVVVVTAVVSAGCGSSANASAETLKLGQVDNGKSFTVKVGDTIRVVIPGNPTTGYEWTGLTPGAGDSVLEQVGEPLYAADNTDEDVVGSGGVYTFTYKAIASGEATIALEYSRSFESVPPIETFTVTVTVD